MHTHVTYTKQNAAEILQISEMTKELIFGGWTQFGPLSVDKLEAALRDLCVNCSSLCYGLACAFTQRNYVMHSQLFFSLTMTRENPFFPSDWFVGTQPSVSQSKSPEQGVSFFSHPRLPPILANFISADCCNNKCVRASSTIFSIFFASLEPVEPICGTFRYICMLSCV